MLSKRHYEEAFLPCTAEHLQTTDKLNPMQSNSEANRQSKYFLAQHGGRFIRSTVSDSLKRRAFAYKCYISVYGKPPICCFLIMSAVWVAMERFKRRFVYANRVQRVTAGIKHLVDNSTAAMLNICTGESLITPQCKLNGTQ